MKAIATAIAAAILMATTAVHAGEAVSNHGDWVVLKLEDLETDGHYHLAFSNPAVIKRSHFPYNDGPFRLQFDCYQNLIELAVFSNDGVNLRHNAKYGKVKFDSEPLGGIRLEEADWSSNYIELYHNDANLRNMFYGNRMRLWMPYYQDDVVVDFSLIGMTAAAKEIVRLNGCEPAILDSALKRPNYELNRPNLPSKDEWSAVKCQSQVATYRSEVRRKAVGRGARKSSIDTHCSWMGDELWNE